MTDAPASSGAAPVPGATGAATAPPARASRWPRVACAGAVGAAIAAMVLFPWDPNAAPNRVAEANALLEKGREHQLAGSHMEAIAAYAEALKLDPRSAIAYREQSRSALELAPSVEPARRDEILALADKYLIRALKLEPASVDTLILHGRVEIARARAKTDDRAAALERLAAADHDLSQAIQLSPEVAAGYLERGTARGLVARLLGSASPPDIEGAVGKYQEAIRDFGLASQRDPRLAESYGRRAECLLAIADMDAEQADALRKLALDAFGHELRHTRDPARVRLSIARLRVIQERLGEALTELDFAIAADPSAWQARGERGNVLLKLGRSKEALAEFRTAIEHRPQSADCRFGLALACEAEGESGAALLAYSQALELDPIRPDVQLKRGLLLLSLGQLPHAARDLAAVVERQPRNPKALLGRGQVHLASGALDLAIADLARSIELDPSNPRAHQALGLVQVAKKDLRAAIASFTRAVTADPTFAEGFQARAQARHEAGELASALEDYTQAGVLAPQMAFAHMGRAQILVGQGDVERAIESYSAAIKAAPRMFEPHLERAMLYVRKGELEPAAKDLERATALAPSSWAAWSAYGEVLEARHDTAAAREAYLKARAQAPPDQRAKLDQALDRVGKTGSGS